MSCAIFAIIIQTAKLHFRAMIRIHVSAQQIPRFKTSQSIRNMHELSKLYYHYPKGEAIGSARCRFIRVLANTFSRPSNADNLLGVPKESRHSSIYPSPVRPYIHTFNPNPRTQTRIAQYPEPHPQSHTPRTAQVAQRWYSGAW